MGCKDENLYISTRFARGYVIPCLPRNPPVTQLENHKEKKTKNSQGKGLPIHNSPIYNL